MSIQKKAFVIDDHPLVARGIAAFLKSHCGFDDVLAINNPDELWNTINLESPPAIILLDFWLPDGTSLKLLNELKIKCPATPILLVSADDDIAVQRKVQSAGAQGFILKHETTEVFMQAVASLLGGKTWYINQSSTHSHQPRELAISPFELGLTVRQGEILAMVMKGMPNKRIAQSLSLSEQTIKEHVSGILSRLGVNNRIEAITLLRGRRLELHAQ
ncbi:MAG: response regulator transcription factor [Methylotenera sp.]|nr:response regulator transcription factor [Methylotenera sp.]